MNHSLTKRNYFSIAFCVFTCIIFIFVFHCTHVQMSYVLNSYLLTYFVEYLTDRGIAGFCSNLVGW